MNLHLSDADAADPVACLRYDDEKRMSFRGARVLAFESRRANEIAQLIRIADGEPFVAPALVEIPLEHNRQVFEFADRLYARELDMVILLTGVGTRLLARTLTAREPEEQFREALRSVTVVARGPKPSAVLREWNVPVTVAVPEPNTWREVLEAVKDRAEKRVAVQEYGRSNPELVNGLESQGRQVMSVPVYQWRLPDDTQPLEEALRGLMANRYRAVLFTTGVQVDHLIQFADRTADSEAVKNALRHTFVASIGPDTSEALRSHGIEPAFTPTHPKMGLLVQEAAQAFADRQ